MTRKEREERELLDDMYVDWTGWLPSQAGDLLVYILYVRVQFARQQASAQPSSSSSMSTCVTFLRTFLRADCTGPPRRVAPSLAFAFVCLPARRRLCVCPSVCPCKGLTAAGSRNGNDRDRQTDGQTKTAERGRRVWRQRRRGGGHGQTYKHN